MSEQQENNTISSSSTYNDSLVDSLSVAAIITILVAMTVFWVSGQ